MKFVFFIGLIIFIIWLGFRLLKYVSKDNSEKSSTTQEEDIHINSIRYYDKLCGYTKYDVFFDGKNVTYQGKKIGEYEFDGKYLNVYPLCYLSNLEITVMGSFKEEYSVGRYYCYNMTYLHQGIMHGKSQEVTAPPDNYEIYFDDKFIIFRDSDNLYVQYNGDLYGVLASLVCTQAVLVDDGIMHPYFNS